MLEPSVHCAAAFIGETSLLQYCADQWMQRNHAVIALITDDPTVCQWATTRQIKVLALRDNWQAFLRETPHDYLFSIINGAILPPNVIAAPRRAAINYHDSLLPRYAGEHATSWALLAGETEHGISWHAITSEIDAGDVYRQERVPVAPDETAFSLNMKTYAVACESFAALIDDLTVQRVTPQPQDLRQRTYFATAKRPTAQGIFDWERPATDLDRLQRALDFGQYRNPLALPKVATGYGLLRVLTLRVGEGASAPPGTVVAVRDDVPGACVVVATATANVTVTLATLEGEPLDAATLHAQYGCTVGRQLPLFTPSQRETITRCSERFSRYEAFWVQRLLNAEPYCLPDTLLHATVGTAAAAYTAQRMVLPAEMLGRLQQRHNLYSLSDIIQAVCILYLARLADSWTFDVGLMLAHPCSMSSADDPFAAVVPLRIELNPHATFDEVCAAVVTSMAHTRKRATFPLDIVGRHPALQQHGTAWQVRWHVGIAADAAAWAALPAHVALALVPDDTGGVVWHYRPACVAPATIERLQAQCAVLLAALVEHPNPPVNQLPIITAAEQAWLDERMHSAPRVARPVACIHTLIHEQVQRTPDNLAVVAASGALTYAELDRRADELAYVLRGYGAAPDVPIGIYMERSPDFMVALLGTLKAGSCFVPLDPAYPDDRIAAMLDDADPPVILTSNNLVTRVPGLPRPAVVLTLDALHSEYVPPTPPVAVHPHHLCYMIYTSGSTGTPKGVMVEHRNLVNHALDFCERVGLQGGDRALQFSALSFDAAMEEIFPTWLSGATLVLRPDDMLDSFGRFAEWLRHWQVSVLNLPATFWHAWVEHLEQTDTTVPPSVRALVVGSEPVLVQALVCWQQRTAANALWLNSYGPTETTISATYYAPLTREAGSHATAANGLVPIGRPAANIRAYILDSAYQQRPPGLIGDLYIAGAGVTRGYTNHPQKQAANFLPDPHHLGDRMYRTGDRARWNEDGVIEFYGRSDNQVKLRGFRIELGEIEAQLVQHPRVQAALVMLYQPPTGSPFLAAYLVPNKPDALPELATIQAFVREHLPAYMTPTSVQWIDRIPLLPNGKANRLALPQPTVATPGLAADGDAPTTALDSTLLQLWQQIFQLPVSRHDDFFALGGHSLQAMQLVGTIQQTTGAEVSIQDIIRYPTVASLAATLTARLGMTTNGKGNGHHAQAHFANTAPSGALPGIESVRQPLLDQIIAGSLAPVDAAALGYLPPVEWALPMFRGTGIADERLVDDWCEGLPIVADIVSTDQGRIAYIMLPIFEDALYAQSAQLAPLTVQALRMARAIGARAVSLTGLIPSATRYGAAISELLPPDEPLPPITTGHATTTATVVLSLERLLAASGRELAEETVGVLGVGSIGQASLELMLAVLPHPRAVLLCDLLAKEHVMHALQARLRERGFKGEITLVPSEGLVPSAFYAATVMLGATNVPDILLSEQLNPETLIVDDSAPHCFNTATMIQRLEQQHDVLFTEGGFLQAPTPTTLVRHVPAHLREVFPPHLLHLLQQRDRHTITGCVLSSALTARYPQRITPTVGLVTGDEAITHYHLLGELGYRGAPLQCDGYVLPDEHIAAFRYRSVSSA